MLEIKIEQARNGLDTCQYQNQSNWKYLYSKYKPESIIKKFDINETADSILLLGYGLGYELKELLQQTNKLIYVLEGHPIFIEHFLNSNLNVQLVDRPFAEVLVNQTTCQVINNVRIMQCYPSFYESLFNQNLPIKKNIVVFDYPVIAKDCSDAFKNLGFNVTYITDSNLNKWESSLNDAKPNLLFSINYQRWMAKLAKQIQVPYINWVVDTPNFNLYYEENKHYKNTFSFIYDEAIANDLKQKGFNNVYYLPVAANVSRLQSITLTEADYQFFKCDISFLGNPCIQNEFTKFIEPKTDRTTKDLVEQLIQAQMFKDTFIIKDVLTNDFSLDLLTDAGIAIKEEFGKNVEPKDILSMFLGRYHSFKERIYLTQSLAEKFDLSVYGGTEWKNLIPSSIYKGHADHFKEMPKIFKASKINLNTIRSFVETGLPMRVFDVLGSGGFLLTNSKLDILRYFKDGQDLVVYRDEKDLLEIIYYYLHHELERQKIALNGLNTVKKEHTFEIRLTTMLKMLNII